MHDTMKKPRHKTPSSAKRARLASGADEDDRDDATRPRDDHGSQLILHPFQDEFKTLGIESSPSFVW